ncbi:carbamate kinase [Actinomadura livida]|uniref:Carbamate kinase n=1 Tax=Actinomadura livida TaxID=79909 RepID=A0A7W7MZ16_9ACTN|nr:MULTISPECIES: carbamate kinase [Actinomadura]MBB4776378.1 carbamate kinase [Actinomadura catellatispora]GGU32805.1 carbamate kinase [Actinomadura livida]
MGWNGGDALDGERVGGERITGARIMIALGGNAMTASDGSATPDAQAAAIERAMAPVADLVAAGARVALTHGNGPQVGNLLIKNQLAAGVVPPVPLDWCGAQTQATIGVMIMNALERALAARGVSRPVAAVVTRTLVDAADPGFADPAKPVGRYFPEEQARRAMAHGETWREFGDRGWRRVVASPEPLEVLDAGAAAALLDAGHIVVAAGGGGAPVATVDGTLRGVEAVVDKDLAAQLLARRLGAEILVIATDVEHAMTGFGTPDARPLHRTTVAELARLAAAGHFAGGSMGPKVEAVRRFVAAGGRRAAIASLERLGDAAHGASGTVVEA